MRPTTSPEGLRLIMEFEGFAPHAYVCPGGYRTIGYGHVLHPEDIIPEPLTMADARELLRQDLMVAERAVRRLLHVPLRPGQWDALVSFTFNLGAGALQRSTLRRKANRAEHTDAAAEFHRWVYAGGRKLPGLIRRRAAEAARYLAG